MNSKKNKDSTTLNVVHISAECYPIAKVGGLADVVGALPKYQQKLGINSSVIMPFYDNKFTQANEFEKIYANSLTLGDDVIDFSILKLKSLSLGFDLFCVDIPLLLFKDYVYSFDDTERFLAFQIAVLNWFLTFDSKPSLIHVHDHHTGLIPFMMSQSHQYNSLKNIPTVLTIHNAQYQGWFSHDKVHLIPPFNFNNVGLIDWGGVINPLAAAIKCAWKVTTVSPSYMEELKQEANGLQDLLSHEHAKCVGILNGIDWTVWNPETDTYIVKNYTTKTNKTGKEANKKWLCDKFNLDFKKPLFAFIGRLVGEKGADLLPEVFKKALEDNQISILLLGSGHSDIEEKLKDLTPHQNFNAFIGYDEKLSHIIYAGADFLLMPSRVEPCGLNQMYSLRYGTVPVVNSIGGLKDTVIDIDSDGFGICHHQVSIDAICQAMQRASDFYDNKEKYTANSKKIMEIDLSWDNSAKSYHELYKSLNN